MELSARALAYVFWHWPRPGTASDAYERDLTGFHHRLRGAGVPGLRATAAFRLGQAPWAGQLNGTGAAAPPGPPVYEDWYVVSGFTALEPLKAAAVSPDLQSTHDRAAAAAEGGTAGLYALRSTGAAGNDTAIDLPVAIWLTKPAGLSYTEFDLRLAGFLPTVRVWQRQLTLGPGVEFCVVAPTVAALPEEFEPRIVPRELIV